jgi:tetratricopeptide (TPR) repeat protein
MRFRIVCFLISYFFFCISGFSQENSRSLSNVAVQDHLNFENIHALIVGVSEYKYVTKLNYAANDALLISGALDAAFPHSKKNITTLIDKQATEFSILTTLSKISKTVKSNDLVVFYFAGHGDVAFVEGSQRGYFLTHNAGKSRDYESGGAVRFDAIHDSITKIANKGAQVYFITDACRSGKIIDAKGTSLTLAAFNTGYEKTTKFISCQANELSFEYDFLGHGAFTYYLVKAISGEGDATKDNTLTVRELNDYLINSVEAITDNKQSPTVAGVNRNAPVFFCDNKVSTLFAKTGKSKDSSESRSILEKIPGDDLLSKFESALLSRNYYGNSKSAKFILDNATKTGKMSVDQINWMKNMLIESLLDRGQETMNYFMTGKPLIDKSRDYNQARDDFNLAAELAGVTHPMFQTISNRATFFQSMDLLQQGNTEDLRKAESLLLLLESKESKATYVQQGLAMLYMALNNKKSAEDRLRIANSRIETWSKPVNSYAYLNILSGKLDEAMSQLNSSEKLLDDEEVILLKSQLQIAGFQLMEAQKELERLKGFQSSKDNQEVKLLMGKIEELRGRIKVAESTYREELRKDEKNVTILLRLANLYEDQGDSARAIEFYNRVLAAEPGNSFSASKLNLLQQKSDKSSVNFYNREEVLSMLTTLDKQKKFNEGILLLEEVGEINNWDPDYFFQRGKFLYNLGRKEESISELQKALALSSYHFESIRALAFILIEQKKFNEANDLINSYDKYFLKSAKWLTFKYKAYRLMNSPLDMISILEKAIEIDSFHLEPHREMVQLLIEYNQYDAAKKEQMALMQIGGEERDEVVFYNRVDQRVRLEYARNKFLEIANGINLLIESNPFELDYLFMGSTVAYMKQDYGSASKYLREIQKSAHELTPRSQLDLYLLKAKVLLETGLFKEAEAAFKSYNLKSINRIFWG